MHDYPFPWRPLWLAKALATAPGGVHRATLMLCLAYWAGGCSSIPDDDVTFSALLKLPMSAWRAQKAAVLAAFTTIRPALDQAFKAEDAKHQANVRRGLNAVAKVRARKARNTAVILPNPAHTLPRLDPIPPAHVITRRAGQKSSGKSTASLFTD